MRFQVQTQSVRQRHRKLRCRRGATSLLFAGTAVGFVGLAGLATEGGNWYLVRRHAQNAADVAAYAGALSLAAGSNDTGIRATGLEFANRNGFAPGSATTVSINHPPASGAQGGNAGAVEAVVTQTQPRLFSNLFINSTVTVGARAVAGVQTTGKACVLSLKKSLGFSGNTTVNAGNCALASNATGNKSLDLSGNPTITAQSMTGVGSCFGNQCTGQSYPIYTNAVATTDPFASIQSLTMPTFSGSNCITSGNPVPWTTSNQVAYCASSSNSSWQVNSGTVVDLTPGTYFFYNISIAINAGATVTCSTCTNGAGVTIILTGSPASKVGTLTINGGATVSLIAPDTNSYNSAFNGVLFYRDVNGSSGNQDIQINGGSNISLSGGMYFPGSTVQISGTSSAQSLSSCSSIIGAQVTFTGNSKTDISGCKANQVAQTQAIRMME